MCSRLIKHLISGLAAVAFGSACSDDSGSRIEASVASPESAGAPTTPFSGIGFERFSYQTRSIIRVFVDTEITGLDSIAVTVDGVDFVSDILSPSLSPFSNIQNNRQLLQPRDQKTLAELIGYGEKNVTLSMISGDIERLAVFPVQRNDFEMFGVAYLGTAENTASGYEGWINPYMGGDANPHTAYAPISYTPDTALITGFNTMMNY